MRLFAGIDMGTRDVRCLIVDERGEARAAGRRAWRDPSRAGAEAGVDEIDVERVRAAITAAIGDALAACEPAGVEAVGVTSQRSGVVFVDDDGRVVQAGSNTDARGMIEGFLQQRAHGEAIHRIAGRLPAMLYMPARLAWLRANRPDDAARVRRALSLADWIAFELSDAAATEPMQAAEQLVFDVGARAWSDELLAALEVPASILPPVAPTGQTSGVVTARAAEGFGLPAGIRVVPAGSDTQAALLALGVVDAGQASVIAGTTMLASRVLDRPAADPERRFWLSPHALEDRWVQEAHCGESGAPVEWMATLMGTDPAGLAAEAEAGDAGAAGVAFVDAMPTAVGDFALIRRAGLSMPAPLLALGRPRSDIARAVFEGTAFGACAGLRWLSEQHGDASSITLGGGVTRSRVFAAVVAGVLERPVRVATTPDASALGAAIIAAAEARGNVRAAMEAMADPCEMVEPEPALGYRAHFPTWEQHAAAFDTGTIRLGDMM